MTPGGGDICQAEESVVPDVVATHLHVLRVLLQHVYVKGTITLEQHVLHTPYCSI